MAAPVPGARFAAVVFDLDGTLADTLDDITAAINHTLALAGLPPRTREECRSFVGQGARHLAARALGDDGADHLDWAVAEFRRHYRAHQLDRTRPYEGVVELLAELARRALPVSILSNKPDPATRELVGALFPDCPFRVVAGERPGVPLKPDPSAALEIARRVGVEPARTILVGDSGIDMATARAAGMFAAGVAWGFRDREELAARGADVILERPGDLLGILDGAGLATDPG